MGATGATAASPGRKPRQLLGASYEIGARALRAMPLWLRHAAAAPGGTAWFWLSAAQSRAALDNYGAALGRQRDDHEVDRVARLAFQNTVLTMHGLFLIVCLLTCEM